MRSALVSAFIDLEKAFLTRQHGDILCVYTWINDNRAMVLMPALRKHAKGWYVVAEPAAWKYDDPHYLAQQSAVAASVLDMDENRSTAFRIASIIHEGIPDLIRMPHKPPDRVIGSMGHAEVREAGKVIVNRSVDVTDRGAEYTHG